MGTLHDTVEIQSELWRLRGAAGLEFAKPLTPRLNVYVSPQLTLEMVNVDVTRTEAVTFTRSAGGTTTVASRTETASETDVVPGLLLTAGADCRITEHWLAGASVGWEWLADNPSVSVAGNRVEFDLDGGEFSLYVGRAF